MKKRVGCEFEKKTYNNISKVRDLRIKRKQTSNPLKIKDSKGTSVRQKFNLYQVYFFKKPYFSVRKTYSSKTTSHKLHQMIN